MRITSINKVAQMYQANQMARPNKNNQRVKSDSLQISKEAKDFQTALTTVKASDDIRTDKVEAIKKQMEEGTYQVSNKELAERMANQFYRNISPKDK